MLTLLFAVSLSPLVNSVRGNVNAKRLFDDLLMNYNKFTRPSDVSNAKLTIWVKLRLSQIIDVHEKDQTLTTSVWLKQSWYDPNLKWSKEKYGNVSVLYVPWEMIWVPDLVLYNNANKKYNITIMTKATLNYDGQVDWEPPAIFESLCPINVKWLVMVDLMSFVSVRLAEVPFEVTLFENMYLVRLPANFVEPFQFGSWTYNRNLLDLRHYINSSYHGAVPNNLIRGIDLSDYYPSVEWDVMEIPAYRSERQYDGYPTDDPFVDIKYVISLRRKPLFYTVNLVFPCVGISFLTILVFYLPSDSGEKITLCISILVSLTVFFLLLTEVIPATSEVLPLIGRYLLFTMVMVTLSVIITVIALNLHYRKPTTHRMPKWVKLVFLQLLPKYLLMRRPLDDEQDSFRRVSTKRSAKTNKWTNVEGRSNEFLGKFAFNYHGADGGRLSTPAGGRGREASRFLQQTVASTESDRKEGTKTPIRERIEQIYYSAPVLKAFENVCFIADLLEKKDRDDKIDEDWKFVAMVVDRLFLWIFSVTCFAGTVIIFLQAPMLRDTTDPIDAKYRPTQWA